MTTIALIDPTTGQAPKATAWDLRCTRWAAALDKRLEPHGGGCVFYLGSRLQWWHMGANREGHGLVIQAGRWEVSLGC